MNRNSRFIALTRKQYSCGLMLRSCVYLMYLFFNIHVFMLPTFHGKWIQYICLEPDRGEKGLLFIANAGLYLHCKSYFSLLIVKENCKQIRNLGFSVLYFTHLYTVLAAKGALLHSQVCSHQNTIFSSPLAARCRGRCSPRGWAKQFA